MNYRAYIQSAAWRSRSLATLATDKWRCVLCGATEALHGHHLTYENLGHEQDGDVITLCKDCHGKTHIFGHQQLGTVRMILDATFITEMAYRERLENA